MASSGSAPKIPKLLHQVWFQFAPDKPAAPPPEYDALRQSWRDLHPDWEFKQWNEADSLAFLREHYPESVKIFQGYKKVIMRVDAIRYFLLHHYGGVYVDTDTLALQPLEPLLTKDLVLVRDITTTLIANNGFMAAVPGHPLMKRCCDNLHRTAKLGDPVYATGPLYLGIHWLTAPNRNEIRMLTAKELQLYVDHRHHASWTWISKWRQALNPERRQFMKLEDVPMPLRLIMKGKVGSKCA
jgi:mannosyltransferase OCH1-like enzyme